MCSSGGSSQGRKRGSGIRELTAELAEPPTKRGNFASSHINKKLQTLAFERVGPTEGGLATTPLSTNTTPSNMLQFDSESSNTSGFSEQSTGSTESH